MITCPKCKKQLPDDKKFCTSCGTKIIPAVAPMQNNAQKPMQRPAQSNAQKPMQRPAQPNAQRPMQRPAQPNAQRPIQSAVQANVQKSAQNPHQPTATSKSMNKDTEKSAKTKKAILISVIAVLLAGLITCGIIFLPDLLDKGGSAGTETAEEVTNENGEVITPETNAPSKNDPTTPQATPETKKQNAIKETGYTKDGIVFGCIIIYVLDDNGNVVKETYYSENYDVEYWMEYKYDVQGNVIEIKDFNDNGTMTDWVKNEYDSDGLVTKETHYNSDGSVDYALEFRNECEYDENGRVISEYQKANNGVTFYCNEYSYDAQGRLVKEINGPGELNEVVYEYVYDDNGVLIKTIRNGKNEIHGYDNQGRKIKTMCYDIFDELSYYTIYEYITV